MSQAEPQFTVAASAYDRFVGRYGGALAECLCDRVGLQPGMRALDVGCGPGALPRVLAARLGAGAVSAIDPSEPFVDACRDRVPGADVRVGGAESLPFDGARFDAVLSQLVVNFIPDAGRGLEEMRRVAKPGGVVAAVVWDYAEGMTMLRTFWDAATEVCGQEAKARDEASMRHCTRESLGDLFRASGLTEVAVEPIDVSAAYEDFDDLWWPFTRGVGPAGSFATALPEPERQRLRSAYHRRLGTPEGPFELTARAWCAVGRN